MVSGAGLSNKGTGGKSCGDGDREVSFRTYPFNFVGKIGIYGHNNSPTYFELFMECAYVYNFDSGEKLI